LFEAINVSEARSFSRFCAAASRDVTSRLERPRRTTALFLPEGMETFANWKTPFAKN